MDVEVTVAEAEAVAVDAILVVNKGIWQGTAPQEAAVVVVVAAVSPGLAAAVAVAVASDLVAVAVVTATIVVSLDTLLENAQPMLD